MATPNAPNRPDHKIRINAFLASAGIGSRRSVEELIRDGKVTINRQVVRDLSARVDPLHDEVHCRNRPLRPLPLEYIILHKPRGYACTQHDPHAKQTIYELLPSHLRHLAYAGRLDVDSEGLLLLSNDGAWLNRLTHPRCGITKVYETEVHGLPAAATIERMVRGVASRGEWLKASSARIMHSRRNSALLRLTLQEGKKREIRRLMACLTHPVIRLKRVAVGAISLGHLRNGEWRRLTREEITRVFTNPPSAPPQRQPRPVKLEGVRKTVPNPDAAAATSGG